ncbi:MAG: SurA N-terminal domain-containing protein [Patescibacteria group bacterium]|nr:SurA N-terminal domain-containing protein [Patescibacteria group bacterium]
MPKAVRKTSPSRNPKTVKETSSATEESHQIKTASSTKKSLPLLSLITQPNKKTYLIIVLVGLLLIAYFKKNLLIAATVNGAPISNFELLGRLNEQYRTQTLTQMVNEKLVMDEARKKGVTVSPAEINDRITKLEGNFGGKDSFDALLAQQGQTREGLRSQLGIQLTIEKLYENEASVSADEVSKFIAQNKDQLQSSGSAEQTKEATDILRQQKIAKIFGDKFKELKQQAKITIF